MQISSLPACRRLLFLLLHAEKEIGDVNAGKYQVKAALYSVGYSDAGVYNFGQIRFLIVVQLWQRIFFTDYSEPYWNGDSNKIQKINRIWE